MKKYVIIVIVFLLIYAGYYWYQQNVLLPEAFQNGQNDMLVTIGEEYLQTTMVWRIKDGYELEMGVILDQETVDRTFEYVSQPIVHIPKGAVVDPIEFIGYKTLEHLGSLEVLTKHSIIEDEFYYADYNRLETYPINDNLGGMLRSGLIVDVEITYGNGDYDVVLPKIRVADVISHLDEVGNLLPGYSYKYDVMFSVENEEDLRDMSLASKLGEFNLRAYHSIEQAPSEKTFDFEKTLTVKKEGEVIITVKSGEESELEKSEEEQVLEVKVGE